MDASSFWIVMLLVLIPVISSAWREDRREPREPREMRRGGVHYHSKRHMLPPDLDQRKRMERTTLKTPREIRKKPSGHLTPLEDDEIEIDEVVSVAIGPPSMRPKFDKLHKKQPLYQVKPQPPNSTAVDLVKNVLSQLGRELLTRDVNENFVFGQYVGNTMKKLTNDRRLNMQHDILDLIVKYQRLSSGDGKKEDRPREFLKENRDRVEKLDRKVSSGNDTDEAWPDFSNLAKIVG